VLAERLDKHCIDAEPMLDKNQASRKSGRSAHSFLWICSAFSTVELFLPADRTLASRERCSGCDLGITFFL
jgi:hypothetical protein